jgi:glycosyltransferase involved in cell wall biosynthesis
VGGKLLGTPRSHVGGRCSLFELKIAIISKSDASGGGASRVAEDLAAWLLIAGHQVDHYCVQPALNPRSFQKSLHGDCLVGRWGRLIHRRSRRYGLNEIIPLEYFTRIKRLERAYDVIHFHDHYTAYSLISAGLASKSTRVFFTAHDCLHYTGNGTYPHLPGRIEKEGLGTRLSRLANVYVAENCPLTYIYPSKWLMNEAKHHLAFAKNPVLIPNGFDPLPYRYRPRIEARRLLGLPPNQRIICIAAHYLSDERKGVQYALRAAASVADLDPLVIFVGNPVGGIERVLQEVKFWFAGYVESRERLGLLYAAADVLIASTLQDNLPISVQEAMGAATPVVGFATGGVPEMVEDGRSAWLVPTGDQELLNKSLREALLSNDSNERGRAARVDLVQRFSKEECVRAHEKIYTASH